MVSYDVVTVVVSSSVVSYVVVSAVVSALVRDGGIVCSGECLWCRMLWWVLVVPCVVVTAVVIMSAG